MQLLARLILVLVIAMSIPMTHVQACHADAPAQVSAAHGTTHQQPAPDRAATPDSCIGCIAPATLHPPVLAERIATTMPPARVRQTAARVGATIRPATPPPRLG